MSEQQIVVGIRFGIQETAMVGTADDNTVREPESGVERPEDEWDGWD